MKVIFITELYHPVIGGAETYTKFLVENLAGFGCNVKVYACSSSKNESDVVNGIPVRRYAKIPIPALFRWIAQKSYYEKSMERKILVPQRITPIDLLEGFLIDPIAPHAFLNLLAEKGVDIYHSVGSAGSEHWYAYLASKRRQKPWIASPFFHVDLPFYHKPCILKSMREAYAVLVCTEVEKSFLISHGVNNNKIHVVGAGVDPALYTTGNGARFRQRFGVDEGFMVLFMGRLTYRKGLYHLVKAINKLAERILNIKLVVAGTTITTDIPWRQLLELNEKIIYVGTLVGQDKIDALTAADVLVVPSIDQAIGIVYLEAWCCGKPVISADTAIMREIVGNNECGLLVRFGDVEGLAESIFLLAKDEALRRRLGSAGLSRVKAKYSWDMIIKKVKNIYDEAS